MKSPYEYLYSSVLRKRQTYINLKNYSLIARSLSLFDFKSLLFLVWVEGGHRSLWNTTWGKSLVNPPNTVPPFHPPPPQWQHRCRVETSMMVIFGCTKPKMTSLPWTWPSYPTVDLSSMDLPKPLLILLMLSDSTTSQANKFQMCTKYYFILLDCLLQFHASKSVSEHG